MKGMMRKVGKSHHHHPFIEDESGDGKGAISGLVRGKVLRCL